ncbi:MAG: hypothetical protein HYU66_15195 [Armatimonadetes bacterium]|nr:hypothetical protein [Armatimonadota bacterium]
MAGPALGSLSGVPDQETSTGNAKVELAKEGAGGGPVSIEDTADQLTVTGTGYSLTWSGATGRLTSWQAHGRELLLAGPRLCCWQAPTENHRLSGQERQWRANGLDRLVHRVRSLKAEQLSADAVRVSVDTVAAAAGVLGGWEASYVYTVYACGDVLLEHSATPHFAGTLPRIGLELTLPGACQWLEWYGRGPHESYPDRLQGAPVGVYRQTVDEQYVPYGVPQEHGNHGDVRWATLTDDAGFGLRVEADPLLNVSAHPFTLEDLTEARHTYELPRRDLVTLHLDHAVMGLGNGSCGPGVLPQYVLNAEPVRYPLRLAPVGP